MRFDAYCATIRDIEYQRVVHELAEHTGGYISKGPTLRRYGETMQIDIKGTSAGWVGFDSGNGVVFAEGKGIHTPRWAKVIRTLYPGHTVPRADVCEDYDEPGAFDQLRLLVQRTKGPKVYSGYNKKPDNPELGTTWEAGIRGAPAYLRLYEKGKQPQHVNDGRPDWARLETEFRPHLAAHKQLAARIEPLQFWGLTGWTAKVANALTSCPVARFEQPIREYSQDKTRLYLARAFRRFFEEDLADGVDTIREFQSIWHEDDIAKESAARHRSRH
jgi:hypothetical protein